MNENSCQTLYDFSGFNNNGLLGNSNTPNINSPNWTNNGLTFNATADYVQIPVAASNGLTNSHGMTVVTVFNLSSFANAYTLYQLQDSEGISRFLIQSSQSTQLVVKARSTDGDTLQAYTTSGTISSKKWYVLVACVNLTNQTIHTNISGISDETSPTLTFGQSAFSNDPGASSLGASQGGSNSFNGTIAYTAVYPFVMNSSQIITEQQYVQWYLSQRGITLTTGATPLVNSGYSSLQVKFIDYSINVPSIFQWNITPLDSASAIFATNQNPIYTFTSGGNYTISETVANAGGINTTSSWLNITQTPYVANFAGSPLSGQTPLIVTFTDASTGSPTSYLWNFGDGVFNETQNPVHQYTTPGNYSVSEMVTGSFGSNTLTKTSYINVLSPPYPIASFTSNVTRGPSPLVVQFQDTSGGGPVSAWAWNFNGGTDVQSTLQNPVVTFPNTGQYTVNLTASNINGTSIYIAQNYINVESNYTINTMVGVENNINGAFTLAGIALAFMGVLGILLMGYMLNRKSNTNQDIKAYTQLIIGCVVVVIVGFFLLGIGIGTLGQMFGALAPS